MHYENTTITPDEMADFVARGGEVQIIPSKKISRRTRIKNIRSDKWAVHNTKLTPKRKLKELYK